MQDFIRVDFIQKLWQSQYQIEKKWSNKLLQLNWELAMEQVPKVTGGINFSFLIKRVEYFYVVVFRKQMSVNCVINIKKDDPIHFAGN